ncbi:MAG: relaxase/mobilization nuclease domain-containing protein [Cyanobacteria bacterium SZAS LIN-2]|nr:relaxase/mobilization nuclease domain-containing protein [Cyanobacteria bacterium SZAS LIN-2]
MGKRQSVRLARSPEALDLVSYGRRGPGVPSRFSPEQLAQISRTVRRVPEVMVKVSGGGREAGAVQAHLAYMGRRGKLEIETDDGRVLTGKGAARELVDDWNLDLSAGPYRAGRALKYHKPVRTPKDAHNIVLSMPKGTDAKRLHAAARAFAANQFGGRHRYAHVLHTHQGNPHVHLVVKAKSEQGERLYIRKATLQAWREDFAKELRACGIAANATRRVIRGQTRSARKTPIQRAAMRGESTFMEKLARDIGNEIKLGKLRPEAGKAKILDSRQAVVRDWEQTARQLEVQGQRMLAAEVRAFVKGMSPPRSDREQVAEGILREIIRAENLRRSVATERAPRHPNPRPIVPPERSR